MKFITLHLSIRKSFHCAGHETLEQIVHGVCGDSILGDNKNSTGHNPGQPAVAACIEQEDLIR